MSITKEELDELLNLQAEVGRTIAAFTQACDKKLEAPAKRIAELRAKIEVTSPTAASPQSKPAESPPTAPDPQTGADAGTPPEGPAPEGNTPGE